MQKSEIIERIAAAILENQLAESKKLIETEYPFVPFEPVHRTYTMEQKMEQFLSDGFIDRYSGEKLVNPGIIKVISFYFPKEFPYHAHGKMNAAHLAYWELLPTIDHVVPIAA